MIRLHDALTGLLRENPLLQFGLSHRLFNLSQLSLYLKPLVETRARKHVTKSSILMALSRLQRTQRRVVPRRRTFAIGHISIQTGLSTSTFPKSTETHRGIHKLYTEVQHKNGYITISESTNQITVIVERKFNDAVRRHVQSRALFHHDNIASLGITFDEKYVRFPGMIYILIQQMTLQGVNIVEIASTFTELILYIDEKETKVAFETLYALFAKKD